MNTNPYGWQVELSQVDLAEARARVEQALREQGFGVLTEIDVRATFAKKLGVDFRPYLILGACNPKLAQRALTADLAAGLLLPCNVVLWSTDHGTVVAFADPATMFRIAPSPSLAPIAVEAEQRLRAAFTALA